MVREMVFTQTPMIVIVTSTVITVTHTEGNVHQEQFGADDMVVVVTKLQPIANDVQLGQPKSYKIYTKQTTNYQD